MPIRRELRHLYGSPAWRAARQRILERACHRCEQCGKTNHAKVLTVCGGYNFMAWAPVDGPGPWRDREGREITPPMSMRVRIIRVVLTIAHLNHVPGDDRDENLKALCQWCHLNYDKLHHRETRCDRKDAARPILAAVSSPAAQAEGRKESAEDDPSSEAQGIDQQADLLRLARLCDAGWQHAQERREQRALLLRARDFAIAMPERHSRVRFGNMALGRDLL